MAGVISSVGHRDGYAGTSGAARAEPAPPVALRASPCTTGEPGVGAGLPDRGDDQLSLNLAVKPLRSTTLARFRRRPEPCQ